jgi:hypothetical protein
MSNLVEFALSHSVAAIVHDLIQFLRRKNDVT